MKLTGAVDLYWKYALTECTAVSVTWNTLTVLGNTEPEQIKLAPSVLEMISYIMILATKLRNVTRCQRTVLRRSSWGRRNFGDV